MSTSTKRIPIGRRFATERDDDDVNDDEEHHHHATEEEEEEEDIIIAALLIQSSIWCISPNKKVSLLSGGLKSNSFFCGMSLLCAKTIDFYFTHSRVIKKEVCFFRVDFLCCGKKTRKRGFDKTGHKREKKKQERKTRERERERERVFLDPLPPSPCLHTPSKTDQFFFFFFFFFF